jgi:signal transduction histidine kinase
MRCTGERVWIAWTNKALCDENGQAREILCIGNDITLLKQAEEKLLTYQKQLQSLASELSLAEERERRRIAVDLHDRIAQSLAFARIKIDTIKSSCGSDELGRMLTEVAELLGQTIQETRSLTIEICPPILYELGFEAALEWLSEQTQEQYGIKTSFTNDQQQKPLDDDIQTMLFQATRELLVNIAKHAQARSAHVSIQRDDSHVCISVEDDGIGFDMAAAEANIGSEGGFGLFSIRERLKYLGGSLECNSQAGQGTRISITAPLKTGDRE